MKDKNAKVTITLERYEELLKNENALKSNKKVILITSYDSYVSGKIIVETEAWDEIKNKLHEEIKDYWEMLSASSGHDTSNESTGNIFKNILRIK